MNIEERIERIKNNLPNKVTLVAVSKTKPVSVIEEAYSTGQRDFGENKIQEMIEKYEYLPKDIRWHMIGHVQRNKVKQMAEFVHLIHGVDSLRLLKEIDKQAKNYERVIDCLLQMKIAKEDSKFGMDKEEVKEILDSELIELKNIRVVGLMGMATFTEDQNQLTKEFKYLKNSFEEFKQNNPQLEVLSMGMSGDYLLAIEEGSTMVRIGSTIFGEREYNN